MCTEEVTGAQQRKGTFAYLETWSVSHVEQLLVFIINQEELKKKKGEIVILPGLIPEGSLL